MVFGTAPVLTALPLSDKRFTVSLACRSRRRSHALVLPEDDTVDVDDGQPGEITARKVRDGLDAPEESARVLTSEAPRPHIGVNGDGFISMADRKRN